MLMECSARGFQRPNNPRYTQIAFICKFWRKLSVVSLPFQIFRRLNALFTALCFWNVLTRFPASKQAHIHRNRNRLPILTKNKRYLSPISDISTFKRSFHCIMLLECSARGFQRRNELRYRQIAIIRQFCRKLSVFSLPFEWICRLNVRLPPTYL